MKGTPDEIRKKLIEFENQFYEDIDFDVNYEEGSINECEWCNEPIRGRKKMHANCRKEMQREERAERRAEREEEKERRREEKEARKEMRDWSRKLWS
jgi:hypothetical protein